MTLCITDQGKYMQITSKWQKMNKAGTMRAPIGNAQMRMGQPLLTHEGAHPHEKSGNIQTRYHLLPMRLAKTKMSDDIKYW